MAKHKHGTSHKTTKRYLRITAGPLRWQYVHRIVAAAWIGRDLTKDEEVHHRDQDRRNCHFSNLVIWGEKDHGWVSAKQSYYMKCKDEKEKKEWDAFMVEQEKEQVEAVHTAKALGKAWYYQDGQLQQKWEQRDGLRSN